MIYGDGTIKTTLIGDADLNGYVDIVDVTTIQKFVALMTEFNDEQLIAADVDENDFVDIVDATWIQRYTVEMDVSATRIGEYV